MRIIGDHEFVSEVLQSKGIVIVDFYASWCEPCKKVEAILAKLKGAFKLKIVKINVEQSQEVASKYMISSLPTVMVFVDGAPVNMKQGLHSYLEFEKMVEEHLQAA
jgi:thioredoxin 1